MRIDQPYKYIGTAICPTCDVKCSPEINPKHFKENTIRQDSFEQHRYTETIFLRFREKMDSWVDFNIIEYPLFENYSNAVWYYLEFLKDHYEFSDYCAIIANLKPGGSIPPHIDSGPYFDKSNRIHIPIKTNSQVLFQIGDLPSFHMEEGKAYEIDNCGSQHQVVNYSNEDRYHIIFDLFC